MVKRMKATFDSLNTVDNVVLDLIGTGIPRDNIFIDKSNNRVEVNIPEETEPEITEILKRHNPEKLN
jgi:hypothetical protein